MTPRVVLSASRPLVKSVDEDRKDDLRARASTWRADLWAQRSTNDVLARRIRGVEIDPDRGSQKRDGGRTAVDEARAAVARPSAPAPCVEATMEPGATAEAASAMGE
jgi:hypothetical protein